MCAQSFRSLQTDQCDPYEPKRLDTTIQLHEITIQSRLVHIMNEFERYVSWGVVYSQGPTVSYVALYASVSHERWIVYA